jgi:hypothetical protein
MKLYHYSDKELKVISPEHFGANSYSFNEKKSSNIARSFFYLEPKPEQRLKNCRYCYITNIPCSKLYDLREDKEGLKVKYQGNIDGLLAYIKNNFLGCIYNVGFNIVILFEDIRVIAKTFK